jgi:hypothetical protein
VDLAALVALDSEGFDSEGLESVDLVALAALDSEGLESVDLAALAALDSEGLSSLELAAEALESVDLAALAADEWFDLEPIGGIPNLFSAGSPFLITQYKITGIPIIVNDNNCHQPDLPESCILLANTVIEGMKKTSDNIRLIGP